MLLVPLVLTPPIPVPRLPAATEVRVSAKWQKRCRLAGKQQKGRLSRPASIKREDCPRVAGTRLTIELRPLSGRRHVDLEARRSMAAREFLRRLVWSWEIGRPKPRRCLLQRG